MIPARAHPAIRYPGEKFQQVTARIRYRDRHDRRCRCGRGSINDRLTHDEAPVAGICERTPVPTGASLPSTARRAVHDHIATPATNRDSNPQNDLGTAVTARRSQPKTGAESRSVSRTQSGIGGTGGSRIWPPDSATLSQIAATKARSLSAIKWLGFGPLFERWA